MARVGSKMQRVVSIVANNPGIVMLQVAERVGANGSRKYGYATAHRAVRAGLVWAVRGACGRIHLYPLVRPCAVHEDCALNLGLAIACSEVR